LQALFSINLFIACIKHFFIYNASIKHLEEASMKEKEAKKNGVTGKAIGGVARAAKLTDEERHEIAKKAASARWGKKDFGDGMPEAIKDGQLKIGDVWLDCYVLKDGRRLIHKRSMARALGLKSEGGNTFMKTMGRKSIGSVMLPEMREKIANPIIFKPLAGDPAHGYDAPFFIEVCDTIWEANKQGKLKPSQLFLSIQAEIIMRSCAKIGIIALIDEATGYIRDKHKEEYRLLFKEFIRAEFREWEKEFPEQFFDMMYRLYDLRRNSKNRHPQFFGKFIRRYVYSPLANSNGAILDMLDEKNPIVYVNGGRKHKMFQFLSDEIGLSALRAHIWQLIGIGNSTRTKEGFQRGFKMAFPQTGDQAELFDI
jgi:hypothetical protein